MSYNLFMKTFLLFFLFFAIMANATIAQGITIPNPL